MRALPDWITLALIATCAVATGCRGGGAAEPTDLAGAARAVPRPPAKVVLVGLDGADWNVARPLMASGELPTLAALVKDGASGSLQSIEPTISPALWTTVVTGVLPERHGIRDFVFRQAGSNDQPIVNATIRRRLALWNILSALGLTVGVVDWYATWPAERVNGFIVSDRIRSMPHDAPGVVSASEASLEAVLLEPPPLGPLPALDRLRGVGDPLPGGLDKGLREDLYRFRVARELYRRHRPDFFAFYLKGIDAVSHFYWKHFEPDSEIFGEVDPAERARLGSVVPDYYRLCDELLASFLEVVDEDTNVVVISDHGFRAFGRPDSLMFDLDRLFAAMGLLEFEDATLADRRSERKVRMDTTRAYAHEGTKIVSAFGSRERPVYLNVAGRDPDGVIPEADRERARSEIKARLEALRTDLDTPLFSEVRINETPSVPPQQEPDLVVRVNPAIAFDYEVLIDGRPHALFDDFFWEYGNISGSHRLDGILVARGPGVRAGVEIRGANLVDVAPTVLRLAGVPVPGDLDGKPLRGLLVGRDRDAVRVVSYETLIDREQRDVDIAPLDEEYRERLRALGYIQ